MSLYVIPARGGWNDTTINSFPAIHTLLVPSTW